MPYGILFSICDGHLITGDHRILIGCNTFLWATRASSHDVATIKKVIKIFSLACKWSNSKHHWNLINEVAVNAYSLIQLIHSIVLKW